MCFVAAWMAWHVVRVVFGESKAKVQYGICFSWTFYPSGWVSERKMVSEECVVRYRLVNGCGGCITIDDSQFDNNNTASHSHCMQYHFCQVFFFSSPHFLCCCRVRQWNWPEHNFLVSCVVDIQFDARDSFPILWDKIKCRRKLNRK